MFEIEEAIAAIKELDREAMDSCQERLDNLIKPLGSLDALEALAVKMAGISRNPRPGHFKKSLIILAADHGIVLEKNGANRLLGTHMALNVAKDTAVVNSFIKHAEVNVLLADMGLLGDLPEMPGIFNLKIARGTKNITNGAAMTKEEAIRAIKAGIGLAENEISRGIGLIGLGETGVGNNVSSAAIVAACCRLSAASVVNEENFISKEKATYETNIIKKVLSINNPEYSDALDILSKVGGFEIAGMVGVILGAARGRAAIVVDGAATSAAALLAVKLAPLAKDFLIGSLKPWKLCHQKALEALDLRTYLDLDMRITQGCGAVLGMSLVKASVHILNDMKTFAETGVAVAQDGIGKSRQKSCIHTNS